jgi:hypothetical protein
MIIKLLLIAAALGFGFLVLREKVPGQHLALRRATGLAVMTLAILAVLWPSPTTYIANAVGVGRGTDLVLYALVMVFLFNAVATAQRLHKLEFQITILARELAIERAQSPTDVQAGEHRTQYPASADAKADQ